MALVIRMLDSGIVNPREYFIDLAKALPLIILIHLLANVISGAYGHVWEHASIDEALKVVIANTVAGGVVLGMTLILKELPDHIVVPASVVVMGSFLSLAGMGLVRFRSRLFSFRKTGGEPGS